MANQIQDYTKNLFGSVFPKEEKKEADTLATAPAHRGIELEAAPASSTGRHYRRKAEKYPRGAISDTLAEELQLTPEMVAAINKIRERDRTAKEKDTRPAATYGLREGYTRQTIIIRQDHNEAIKQLAKSQDKNIYEIIEEILTKFFESNEGN